MAKVAPPDNSMRARMRRLEQSITAIFRLGRTERRARHAERQTRGLHDDLNVLRNDLSRVHEALDNLHRVTTHQKDVDIPHLSETLHAVVRARAAESHRMMADLSRRLDLVAHPAGVEAPAIKTQDEDPGLQLFLDSFYHNLENRYRGSVGDIQSRLAVYRPDVEAAHLRSGGKPVLDLGCGRGEWLRLLDRWGIPAWGVDLNAMQIEDARNEGLDARQDDMRHALSTIDDNSLSAISAHHLIEHLDFNLVGWLVREAMRVLAPGGLLLLETPDVRNVLVGATSFHNDPTHLQPRTEAVLQTLLQVAGFEPVEARHLHPHERLDEFLKKPNVDQEIAHLLFGPQDLTVIGYKPMQAS